MRISMPVKIIIGIFTAWIVISPVLFFGIWFFSLFSFAATESQVQPNPNIFPAFFFPFFLLIFCSAFINTGLGIFYIVHIILNKTGSDVARALLGVGMLLLPFIAMPVYYFIYILPENPPQWALVPTSSQAVTTPPLDTPPASRKG